MFDIAEGFSRRSTKELVQSLFIIAKGSAAEVQSHLCVALDQGYIDGEDFGQLYSKSDEVSRLTSGFIQYLLSKDKGKPSQLDKSNKPGKLDKRKGLNKLVEGRGSA
jgi:hypothetical protein